MALMHALRDIETKDQKRIQIVITSNVSMYIDRQWTMNLYFIGFQPKYFSRHTFIGIYDAKAI